MENIRFRIETFDGLEVDVNVKSANIFEAAKEIHESLAAGDVKVNGIPVKPEEVYLIKDIVG